MNEQLSHTHTHTQSKTNEEKKPKLWPNDKLYGTSKLAMFHDAFLFSPLIYEKNEIFMIYLTSYFYIFVWLHTEQIHM